MLCLLMTSEVHLPLEGSGATGTGERFKSTMLPAVCDEVRRLREGFATDATRVGLLT